MEKKFDVVIGNPPYQKEATGDATHAMPIYHKFMEAAYEVGSKAVLITPARFLFDAGYTPKAWNETMLSDRHLSVPYYEPNSNDLFPGTDIKGGIAVTYRDEKRDGEPIGTFTKYPELNEILHKVMSQDHSSLIEAGISSGRSYRYTDVMHADNPQAAAVLSSGHQYVIGTHAFQRTPFLFHDGIPNDGKKYSVVLGLDGKKRARRWVCSDYISGPDALDKFKVAVTAANGSGQLGEALSSPLVVEPNVAVTQTFLTIGSFSNETEANDCLKYVKSKFARVMLGVLKVTQHNPAKVWKYVPLQDFTGKSDIDWSKSIPEIDEQLYKKYGLSASEIDFIESNVKAMD
ncbi:restriction endonuclease [Glutamicibacter soli]|uniref:Restriction endonuclease n=2 Tax=Glutamicibacter soli TaxID=453836 RepID=A0A365YM95_9MICC|nr:Eco57I restriction-modification methylase domain-containing protein [Glutamicibacter soli]RBM03104.1 restriction endonuclease [Glutamicibacter soli]